jgi:IS30 family transposase
MKSPGSPPHQREAQQLFWIEIAKGVIPAAAAIAVGASQPVGQRWFHNAGGMPPFDLEPLSSRYLSFAERMQIEYLLNQNAKVREIARVLDRHPSSISREVQRNAATRIGGGSGYRANVAQWKAELAAKRPKVAKLVANPRLRDYVQERLSGGILAEDGRVVLGPVSPRFTGNNKPFRKDRAWSPEQIANRLRIDYPGDRSMRISHEAIYQSLYIQGRGALKRELIWCLRTGRALREPRERPRRTTWAHVTDETLIRHHPPEVADRAVPGHWE